MRVRAFAKINRSLRVLGIRADGYHELRTIFQSIALHDTLTIRAIRGPFRADLRRSGLSGRRHQSGRARGGARCGSAAGRRGAPRGVAIDLQKRIPMQAGLGGGSSDAAAALRALATRWRVADAKVARRGRGARRRRAVLSRRRHGARPRARRSAVSVSPSRRRRGSCSSLPDFGVSTRDAFGWFDAQSATPRPTAALASGSRARAGQRSRGAGGRAPPGNRPYHFGTPARRARRRRRCRAAARPYSACFPSRPAAIRAAKRLASAGRRTLVTQDPQPPDLPETCRHISPSDKLTLLRRVVSATPEVSFSINET